MIRSLIPEFSIRLIKTYAKWTAVCIAGLGLLLLLWPSKAGTVAEHEALEEGRVVITYWDRHSGHEFEARRELIDEFNLSQDEIYVRTLPIGVRIEKLLTATAGGAPPDVCSLENTVLAQLAPQGCFLPIETLMEESDVFDEDRFFPHVWKMVAFDEHVWGLPTTTDAFCLLWNKDAFRRAGLDPEQPPRTLRELEDFAARLTVRNADGGIDQIGFLPWAPWDLTFMWGGLFGGQWLDESTGRATCGDDPAIIASLAWQQSFSIDPKLKEQLPFAIDPEKLGSFRSLGEYMSANNPFYSGKVAMITEGEWQVTFIEKYAPNLDWGAAPIPQPEGVSPRAYAPTCVVDAIPTGTAHLKEAWTFLKWFYSPRPDGRPSPVSDYCAMIHNIATRRDEALQDRFVDNPKFKVFIDGLLEREAVYVATTPVAQFMLDDIERTREYITFREVTPEAGAKEIQARANAELDRINLLIQTYKESGS